MAIVRAAVIKRGNKDFLVRPSVVFLEAGDVFRLLNTTGHNVTIVPIPGGPAGPQKRLVALLQLPGRYPSRGVKKGEFLEVAAPVPLKRQDQNRFWRYRVTVDVNGTPIAAVGDSDPVIIIDNP